MACRWKPTCSGSVTATICMTPGSSSRCTRWRTAASDSPTALPMVAYGPPAVLLQLLDDRLGHVVERTSALVLAGRVTLVMVVAASRQCKRIRHDGIRRT